MYYRHFGLDAAPFRFGPQVREVYLSQSHREALAALEWGVLHEPSGFTLLIGETGTGKTTLLKTVLARKYAELRAASVSNPKLGFKDMLREMVRQFELAAAPQKYEMFEVFDRFLQGLQPRERAVVVVDEAQDLDDDTLEELRLLSNRGDTEEKRLHLVLAGQPELMRRLMQPALRQLNDRIGARAMLNPLTPEEARGYLEFRLKRCGGSTSRVFELRAAAYIVDCSGGIPRRINVLAHNAMLLAYSAGVAKVDLKSAHTAVAEFKDLLANERHFEKERSHWSWLRVSLAAAGIAVLGIVVIAADVGNVSPEINPRFTDDVLIRAPRQLATAALVSNTPRATAKTFPAVRPVARAAVENHNVTHSFAGTAVASTELASAVASTELASTVVPASSNPREIRVQLGDTLEHIAVHYLGSEDALKNLIDANPQLPNADLIYPGEIVHLPADSASQE